MCHRNSTTNGGAFVPLSSVCWVEPDGQPSSGNHLVYSGRCSVSLRYLPVHRCCAVAFLTTILKCFIVVTIVLINWVSYYHDNLHSTRRHSRRMIHLKTIAFSYLFSVLFVTDFLNVFLWKYVLIWCDSLCIRPWSRQTHVTLLNPKWWRHKRRSVFGFCWWRLVKNKDCSAWLCLGGGYQASH